MYIMADPTNKTLYNKIKKQADKKFDKPSAYKSAWVVREYKKQGGKYKGRKTTQLKKSIKAFS